MVRARDTLNDCRLAKIMFFHEKNVHIAQLENFLMWQTSLYFVTQCD